MKKYIIGILLAICMLGILGSSLYAVNYHVPDRGNKLVGLGTVGSLSRDTTVAETHNTVFTITNPDCVNSIVITKVSILQGDILIYEGPFVQVNYGTSPPTRTVFPDFTLAPHQIARIALTDYQWKGGLPVELELIQDNNNWKPIGEVLGSNVLPYTVEVFWKPYDSKPVNPLSGWGDRKIDFYNDSTLLNRSLSQLQMLNLVHLK
jgi:hypothetical protein